MTIATMAVQRAADRAFILSDTANTDAAGVVVRSASKVVYGTQFAWALAVSGNMPPEVLIEAIAELPPETPTLFYQRLPAAMRNAVMRASEARGVPASAVLVQATGALCHPDTGRIEGFFVSSAAGTLAGQATAAFTWYETDWIVQAPPAGLSGLLGRPVDPSDPASFDPETDGVTLADALRIDPPANVTPGIDPGVVSLGCNLEMTLVTAAGVEIWHLHEWPDQIGQRIVPNVAGDRVTTSPVTVIG